MTRVVSIGMFLNTQCYFLKVLVFVYTGIFHMLSLFVSMFDNLESLGRCLTIHWFFCNV